MPRHAAQPTDPAATYLDSVGPALDNDGNGTADALTDGLLILRYRFGLRGNTLIAGTVEPADFFEDLRDA